MNVSKKINVSERKMMNNLQNKINKVFLALQIMGFYYRVNQIKFFSEKTNKYCKKFELYNQIEIEEINKKTGEEEKRKKYIKVLDTFSQVELLKYLISELDDYRKELNCASEGSEANGK
jgi:hypothetical protein